MKGSAAAGFGLLIAAFPAFGQDKAFPALSGELTISIIDDFTYRSQDSQREVNDLFTKSGLAVDLALTPQWSIATVAKLEPVKGPTGDNRIFGGHGAWIEELYTRLGNDDAAAFAGKFNPGFGLGWDLLPEVYGKDFAADYEIKEKIGAGGFYVFDAAAHGKHRFSATVFFADDTGLSNSIINRPTAGATSTLRPGRVREANGGISNTESLRSFTASLDGSDIALVPGLLYHLGVQHQQRSDLDANSQNGAAAALQYRFELSEDSALEPFIEYVALRGATGAEIDRDYLTASLAFIHGHWTLRVTHSARDDERRGTDATTGLPFFDQAGDRLNAVSLGYNITDDLNVAVGWRRTKIGAVTSDSTGLFVEYSIEF